MAMSALFTEHLGKEYTQPDYVKQFTFRVPENLAKLDRVEAIYKAEEEMPQIVFDTFDEVRARLKAAQQKHGDHISPFDLIEK
jgi:phosphoenolpyruvate carboxykinase (GTP)